ncbi:MAG: alkylmercury lyase family protein [Solirubrobacteraceae bacterium]
MSERVPATLCAAAIPPRSFAERAGDLTPAARALYERVLESFIAGSPTTLYRDGEAATALVEADLIQTDGDRSRLAYPFSAQPTRHRVRLRGGRVFYAMCALDALGIPYMLHEPGEVDAREPDGPAVVRVAVDPGAEPTWTPARAVAVLAADGGCCLAQSACPHINLFASAHAAARYLGAHALKGQTLSIPDATSAGRWLFGDLLDRLTDTETVR